MAEWEAERPNAGWIHSLSGSVLMQGILEAAPSPSPHAPETRSLCLPEPWFSYQRSRCDPSM